MIPLERFYCYKSYWPHQYLLEGEKPIEAFFEEHLVEWIMLSDRWPRSDRHPPLMDYLSQRAEPGPVFSPSKDPDPSEATLPMDMDFPLCALWQLDRPGPRIRLFKVKGR